MAFQKLVVDFDGFLAVFAGRNVAIGRRIQAAQDLRLNA